MDNRITWLASEFFKHVASSNKKILEVQFKDCSGVIRKARVPDDSLWGAVKDVLLLEEYEMLCPFKPKDVDVIVDAGAHVGLYALKVATNTRKVIAIEPNHVNYMRLSENIYRNLLMDKIIPLQTALWKRSGSVIFSEEQNTGEHSMFGHSERRFSSSSITLHELIHRYGDISLMKMDIEGAEHEVLLNTRDDDLIHIDKIVAELHPGVYGDKGIHNILLRLRGIGFRVSLIKPPFQQPLSYILQKVRKSQLYHLWKLKLLVIITYAVAKLLRLQENTLVMLYSQETGNDIVQNESSTSPVQLCTNL